MRTPLKGWHNHVWNVLGARTLSTSGRQLFTIDKFRDTGRPLLSVLADPNSIFMSGLRKFKRHTLYTNIVNDRSAVHYTTGIEKTDRYTDLENIKVNYLKDYAEVILDPDFPVAPAPKLDKDPKSLSWATKAMIRWVKRIPFMLTLAIFVPIGVVAFLCNSVIQTARSSGRIKLHEKGKAGVDISEFRGPVLLTELREEVEHVFEALNNSQHQEYLGSEDEEADEQLEPQLRKTITRERRMSMPSQPTLALAPCQFEMVDSLDSVKWRKYPVWIHENQHSHAAIIVRMEKPSFKEGYVVLKHFVQDEFLS